MVKKAFVFPGQGSQFVGMGKVLAKQFPEAKAVFDEVDDTLGQKLSKIMFEGPDDVLTLTANAQPALMAVSIAVLRVMESMGFVVQDKICYVAGHSLGEYSALCAAGMFSLRDTAFLLRLRGDAMQKAVPLGEGAMAAIIGLADDVVSLICSEVASSSDVCQIANDNGGQQIVISGNRKAVENAAVLATEKGARRAVMLSVSAPFHSILMMPAAETMRLALSEVNKKPPVIPVVSNVSAWPEQDAEEISELLVKQVTGRVRWRETMEWLFVNGVTDIYEIGAGRVLSGLARRINKELRSVSVDTADGIEKVLKTFDI